MREIKFRAWGKKSKFMQAVCYLSWLAGGLKAEDAGVYIDNGWVTVNKKCKNQENVEPEVILMQYIGLKDKNGKEIYEGDIIRNKHDDIIVTIGAVEYSSKGYWVKKGEGKYGCHSRVEGDSDSQIRAEIIGNIYETPELLEATC